jgi:hypothetical protein
LNKIRNLWRLLEAERWESLNLMLREASSSSFCFMFPIHWFLFRGFFFSVFVKERLEMRVLRAAGKLIYFLEVDVLRLMLYIVTFA